MNIRGIRAKLVAGFALIAVILFMITSILFYQLNIMEEELNQMMTVEFQLYSINHKIAFNIAERSSNLRGYFLTGEEEYFHRYAYLSEENNELFQQLFNIVDEEQDRLLQARVNNWERIALETVIPMYQQGEIETAIFMMTSSLAPEGASLIYIAEGRANNRENTLTGLSNDLLRRQQQIRYLLMSSSGIGLLLAIILAVWISNIITKPINQLLDTVEKIAKGDLTQEVTITTKDEIYKLGQAVNTMAGNLKNLIGTTGTIAEQVAVTSQQLSASSQEVSAASEEVSSTITEVARATSEQAMTIHQSNENISNISLNMKEVSQNIDSIENASANNLDSAQEGMTASKAAVEKMSSIKDSTEKTADVILTLNKGSQEIEKIVETISAIAEQTNLLALNAAIEAARAGEAGRGFAVVAEEIRKLAEQSANSSNQITQLILAIQSQVQDAVDAMNLNNKEVEAGVGIVIESSNKFEKILEEAGNVVKQVENTTAITKKVVDSIDEITNSFEIISAISQDTAASSEEVSASAEEQTSTVEEIANAAGNLASKAEELIKSIDIFKI
ncbi:MAG: methyl-accepting chemotaxis protein [Clostridiaceae bacterium]|nr:methyl-accepting chemotaxis protein [Clostridiaceae bacterium]